MTHKTSAIIGAAALGLILTTSASFAQQPPAIILMAGLQGVGKTTTSGKLAKYLKEEKKKKVLTVSADVYRPAAIAQLQSVSQQTANRTLELVRERREQETAAEAGLLFPDLAPLSHRRNGAGR